MPYHSARPDSVFVKKNIHCGYYISKSGNAARAVQQKDGKKA